MAEFGAWAPDKGSGKVLLEGPYGVIGELTPDDAEELADTLRSCAGYARGEGEE